MAESVRSRSNSVRENLLRWQALANNSRLHAEEVAGLPEQLTSLEEVLARITSSLFEQEVHTMTLRNLLRTREADIVLARDLRQRVSGILIGHFGVRSEKLRQFGLKPQSSKRRRKPAEGEPEAPIPTPAPGTAASE